MADQRDKRSAAEKPISLSPLSLDEALEGLVRTGPVRNSSGGQKPAESPRPKSRRQGRASRT